MKIYTEINYKWLDGQLVKTDSKSFEYDGEVSLCSGIASGIASGVSGIGTAATGKASTATGTASQGAQEVLGAVTEPLSSAGEIATDAVDALETTVVDPITNATDQITDVTAEGLSTGMEAIGEEGGRVAQGAMTTLEPLKIGGTTEHLLNKFQDTIGGGLDGLTTTLNDGLSALTGGGGGGQNKVDVEKMSRKGKIKNKSASKLAVNKSKGRARKSLRIG